MTFPEQAFSWRERRFRIHRIYLSATALKRFVNAEITNQHPLDQSVIAVDGVRIALNLQLVE
jgi:hypothetical protein